MAGRRLYDPNEIVVLEHGCRDVETLESPYTETTGADSSSPSTARLEIPKITILKQWRDNKRVDVGEREDELDFTMEGISPAMANLFRRVMLMDVATMAVDVVVFHRNDGVVFDEALAHRIGLVPLDIDAELMKYCTGPINTASPDPESVLKFELKILADRDDYPVYSSDLVFVRAPGEEQSEQRIGTPRAVHKKILLARLAKGHGIHAECYAIKGTGAQHSKWSAVACTSYKPLPIVRIPAPVTGEQALELKSRCPMGVFDIEDSGKLFVANAGNCTMCRECIRKEKGEVQVQLGLRKHDFLFHIESVGVYRAREVFRRGLKAFAAKARLLAQEVENTWPSTMTECTDPSKEDYL